MYRDLEQESEIQCLAAEIRTCPICTDAFPDNILTNIIAAKSRTGIGFWSDAYPNFTAKLMIVGQDWGSELSVTKKAPVYEPYYWEEHFESWKTLMRLLKGAQFKTAEGEYEFTDIYLTNALLCARKGDRDTGPVPHKYFDKCWHFLERQINIIRPKVIATLGERVFHVVAQHRIPYRRFKEVVAQPQYIGNGMIIFPLYHTGYWGSLNRGRVEGSFVDDFKNLRTLIDRC